MEPKKLFLGHFIPLHLLLLLFPALEMFTSSIELTVVIAVPLALLYLSVMTGVSWLRMPKKSLSHKHFCPFGFQSEG